MNILPYGFALLFLLASSAQANQDLRLSPENIVVKVNGEGIHQSELDESLKLAEFVVGVADFEQKRAQIENSNLQNLIDRRLLLREFKRSGGKFNSEYVTALVDEFIARRFEGNRDLFEAALSSCGFSEADLQDRFRDDLIRQTLRSEHGVQKDINNPLSASEVWLDKLRDSASIEVTP